MRYLPYDDLASCFVPFASALTLLENPWDRLHSCVRKILFSDIIELYFLNYMVENVITFSFMMLKPYKKKVHVRIRTSIEWFYVSEEEIHQETYIISSKIQILLSLFEVQAISTKIFKILTL